MPRTRDRARPRRLIFMAALPVVAVAALLSVAATISARPPSPQGPIPPEAFQPVTAPRDDERTTSRRSALARLPDAGLAEPSAPLSPSPAPTPEPTPPAGPEHVVRTGDTLWQIAVWHRGDLEQILRWNRVDPRRLVAGQRILVPGGEPMPTPPPAPATGSGKLAPLGQAGAHRWPLPIRGRITTHFSAAHQGIDIAAPAGTTVRAIAGGTVTWAGWKTTGGGNVVVIQHPNGMISRYLHNREVTVRVGQVVASGEQIATVGETGWATGPHLDLRVQMGGDLIDPLRLDWTR